MFDKKTKVNSDIKQYDKSDWKPVIKCSICNGEQVAGFKNIHTGRFEEIMLIKDNGDLADFKKQYALTDVSREY